MRGFTPYKGRSVAPGDKVKAYWNLHKKVWSLVAVDGPFIGRVVGHVLEASLGEVEFQVSEAGRQRVIREEKKNVHAFAIGTILCEPVKPGERLSYNPYKGAYFVRAESGEPIAVAGRVLLASTGKAYAVVRDANGSTVGKVEGL